MAKRRPAWERVFDRVTVQRPPEWVTAPKPTAADFDAAEARLGLPLPRSYRAFMERFGPGELAMWVGLDQVNPGKGGRGGLVGHTHGFRECFAREPASARSPEWFARVVCFGGNGGGDAYVWMPDEVTDRRNHEYRTYRLPHGFEHDREPAGDTFGEFLRWASTSDLGEELPEGFDDDRLPLVFRPLYLRMKKPPAKRDVKAWLAWNGEVVRGLARAAREDGLTDRLPILADALEEAGCKNADLLDACRHGDPAIDGAWALRVLLGD